MSTAPATPADAVTRPPLARPAQGRVLGGVCAGLAEHLDLPVAAVRWAFVGLGLMGGAGVVAYLWLVLTAPSVDADEQRPTRLARLVPRLREPRSSGVGREALMAVGLIALALVLLVVRAAGGFTSSWLLAAVVILAGAGLAWSQLAEAERSRAAGLEANRAAVVLRVAGGTALAVIGVVLLVGQGESLGQVVRGALAGLAILAGVALVLAPIGLRAWRQLTQERAARVREAERADIAAHLHDSVLQTLSLIRSRASDPAAVTQLARAQERQLREWLYTDRPDAGDSLAAQIKEAAAQVEDLHAVPVDVVTVGDAQPDGGSPPLVAAAREALGNAVRHGRPPVSVFAEIGPERAEVFVRDRGEGFDPDAVPADRHGVRESILDRMRRHGGSAQVRSRPGSGTEIHLSMPREDTR